MWKNLIKNMIKFKSLPFVKYVYSMIENYNILKSLNIYLIDNSDIKCNPSTYWFETNEFKLEINPRKYNIFYGVALTKKQDYTLNNKPQTRPLNYITFKLPFFLIKDTLNDIKFKVDSFEINKENCFYKGDYKNQFGGNIK